MAQDIKVYVNGQEAQFEFDSNTGVIHWGKVNLAGETIPPIPDVPENEQYRVAISYETEFEFVHEWDFIETNE